MNPLDKDVMEVRIRLDDPSDYDLLYKWSKEKGISVETLVKRLMQQGAQRAYDKKEIPQAALDYQFERMRARRLFKLQSEEEK